MQKTVQTHEKNVPFLFRLLRSIFSDPYDSFTPSPTLPDFNFGLSTKPDAPKRHDTPKKDLVVIPTGFKEKLTSTGVTLQKTEVHESGIEVELMHLKDAKLQECELNAILEKYPSLNKNAVFISKRCWSKGATIPQTIIELKKNGCEYSRTYVAFFRKVFDEFETKIGEVSKEIPLPFTPYSKNVKKDVLIRK